MQTIIIEEAIFDEYLELSKPGLDHQQKKHEISLISPIYNIISSYNQKLHRKLLIKTLSSLASLGSGVGILTNLSYLGSFAEPVAFFLGISGSGLALALGAILVIVAATLIVNTLIDYTNKVKVKEESIAYPNGHQKDQYGNYVNAYRTLVLHSSPKTLKTALMLEAQECDKSNHKAFKSPSYNNTYTAYWTLVSQLKQIDKQFKTQSPVKLD
jgi:hypothetical protein